MVAGVADTHPVEARSSLVTVVEACEVRAVFAAEAGDADALAIYAETIAVAVVGTGAFSAVLPGVAFVAVAGAVLAASAVVAVFGADEFRAVEAGPGFVAHAVSVVAAAATQAVVEALGLRAVLAEETIRADANAAHALASRSAVHRASAEGAVFSGEALEALALSVNAASPVLAVVGTLGFSAVGSLPAGLTNTVAGSSAVVSMAVAVRFSSHLTFDKKVKTFSSFSFVLPIQLERFVFSGFVLNNLQHTNVIFCFFETISTRMSVSKAIDHPLSC